ncbi:MAG: YfhO family protein [Bacilli bacterium]|nr:YfhO family protein [Bacilli bacterium]
MAEEGNATPSLREIRAKKSIKKSWFREHFSFLFSWRSTFYYGLFLFLLGALWAAYPLFDNSWTQLLNWDYTWQYISFTYDYWDAWHLFFTTGRFPLYDPGVYMGTDMIGSGSYYGLFDPFMFICYLFPRAWIPQMYAQMTFVKIMFGGLMMRCYLKNMGIKEWTARIGGVIYAFSGYTTFFEGSPNFTTAMAFFPLILWGLEKVIKEQKPTLLILGVFGLGISCFFYVPVLCIFGVIYAGWRYFTTIKTRDVKTNFIVIGLGVMGFAVGLMLSAFSLLPSIRETMLSGRSASIGTAYWHSLKNAFKAFDFRMFFTYAFEEVGDNPGRELMGLISFFFPTGGWTQLPIARSANYDAWTASIFCYTPCVILFFTALINSVRMKKWSHFLAVFIVIYALFTNFSYFAFYAFTGNGYGRWYLILIPIITYYCCWGFDQRKEEPKFIPLASTVLALASTLLVYALTEHLLKDKIFSSAVYNIHNTTYWSNTYYVGSEEHAGVLAQWYLYYQLAFVAVEGVLYCVGHRHNWLKYALFGLVAAEVIVMGNLSYAFNGTWSLRNSYAGGESNVSTSLHIANKIKENDKSFFRTNSDTFLGSNYAHNVVGLNATASFHSLMNFDVEDFAINNQMKMPGSAAKTYGDEEYYNPNWSGYYGNKRYSVDTLLGTRYYIVSNYCSWLKDGTFLQPNVPFNVTEMDNYSPNRDNVRVYRRNDDSMPLLGYAVDSDMLYRMGRVEDSHFANQWYSYNNGSSFITDYAYLRQQWLEHVQLHGAIIDDDVTLPESFVVTAEAPVVKSDADLESLIGQRRMRLGYGLKGEYYETASGDGLFAKGAASYRKDGVGYFLDHYDSKKEITASSFSMKQDLGKLTFIPSNGEYFNQDREGCYIEFRYYNNTDNGVGVPRIYVLGDKVDENGNVTEENACLAFDYNVLKNAKDGGYYHFRSCTFGLYVRGRAKRIVMCHGGNGSFNVSPQNFYCSVYEKSKIDQFEAEMQENSLQNVKMDTNLFTFQTAYDKDRIVLTQLGYDKGWQATAKLPDGKKVSCQMIRLDGGLVGFVAPSVLDENGNPLTVSYELRYATPFGLAGVALWTLGIIIYSTYLGISFFADVRKKKKEPTDFVN